MKAHTAVMAMLLAASLAAAQEPDSAKERRMEWFADAKLGIFIHWGIYAVNGIDESWSFYNGLLTYDDYMKQLNGFTASHYDPAAWARLFRESGARYAVLTSKHHDGVALWDTKLSDLSVVKKTPAGRDLIGPFCKALRNEGLHVGLYFSHLDWSHPDYPHFTRNEDRYVREQDTARWNRFLEFHEGQIREIATQFRPDLFWFDGDWDYDAAAWKAAAMRAQIAQWLPRAIVNSRINGYGDYDTPEQGVPITAPRSRWWELCMTTNDSWGYQGNDRNYKTPNQVIRILVDCISMGGNLLLDIGPKEDGTIPPEQVNVLREVGRWTSKHREAVYGTRAGISKDYFYGPTALSKDRTTLYLYVDGTPSGPLLIKGLKNRVNRAWVVGNGTKLETKLLMKMYWSKIPGLVYIDVPRQALDPQLTVIGVLLDGPIDLFTENAG
ncbi:MAG TPA: alpha-L-fucosidase [Bacteroidota bacterium]|nr:alpha-L-fucosidase [Bacteroidota bacterium]